MEYEIKTIEDVIKVVNESNINNFLVDFGNYLKLCIEMQKIEKVTDLIKQEKRDIFHWIDDGKNEQIINILPRTK